MSDPTQVDIIKKYGFSRSQYFTDTQVQEMITYLKEQVVYTGSHVVSRATGCGVWEDVKDEEQLSWSPKSVIQMPHFLEYVLHCTPTAREYLYPATPLLYYVNAFCTRPAKTGNIPYLQDWHVDHDDTKFLPLFTFLTDVGADDAQELMVDGEVKSIFGPPGTCFFSDTSRVHRGRKPTKERIVLWARWGVSEQPAAYVQDIGKPFITKAELGTRYPSDPFLQETLKLLVE